MEIIKKKLIFCVHADGLYVCVCLQLQDVYAVESSVCLLYAEAVCAVAGLAQHSPALVPTQSHPLVPAFLHSSLDTAIRPFNCERKEDVNVFLGEWQGSFLFEQPSTVSFESCDSIV